MKQSFNLAKALKVIASLKITVALFAMSIFLIFAGTLAQVDNGIWTVISQYFRCYFAYIEWKVFFIMAATNPPSGGFYFPGGYILGGSLLINLMSAHAVSLKHIAKGKRLIWGLLFFFLGLAITNAVIMGWGVPAIATTDDDAFWRVLYRLGRGGFAAFIFLISAFLLFNRRSGIILIHGGVSILLLSELFTALFAIEAQMTIKEGETVNFIDHSQEVELAFVDTSNPDFNLVTVIPQHMLVDGAFISTTELPFDIKVHHFMRNSSFPVPLSSIPESQKEAYPEYAGVGSERYIVEQHEGSGVDTDMRKDTPAVSVEFIDRTNNNSLGLYIFSLWFYPNHIGRAWDLAQDIHVHPKNYRTHLRYRREYLQSPDGHPFAIKLENFSHETYQGTDTPSNYSSDILLINEKEGVNRKLRIWMNNPLRYAKRTFYQASFLRDDSGTVLQVVRNDSWMMPYLACMFVLAGMLVQFGMVFYTFLQKKSS